MSIRILINNWLSFNKNMSNLETHASKGIDKQEYVKWYNLAKNVINNEFLIPERDDNKIIGLVSPKNWLVFVLKNETLTTTKEGDKPNIWLEITSPEKARIGLVFANNPSYNKFKTIMTDYNKTQKNTITKKMLNLLKEDNWRIQIETKTKEYNRSQSPKYTLVKEWSCNEINENIIKDVIDYGNSVQSEGNEKRLDGKVVFEGVSLNLMMCEFPLNENEFSKRIIPIFDVLLTCLDVKSELEINKIKKEQLKTIKKLKSDLESEEETEKRLAIAIKFDLSIRDEDIKANKGKIKDLKSKIEELTNKLN